MRLSRSSGSPEGRGRIIEKGNEMKAAFTHRGRFGEIVEGTEFDAENDMHVRASEAIPTLFPKEKTVEKKPAPKPVAKKAPAKKRTKRVGGLPVETAASNDEVETR